MHNFRNFNKLILYVKLFVQPFAIIAITETWLLDNDALQSYEINNYKLFIKNRKILTEVEGLLCTFTLVLYNNLTVKSYLIQSF